MQRGFWLRSWLLVNKEERLSEERLIKEAHKDWLVARRLFDVVDDPDLVEYAVYSLQAAEKKYAYLLKRARKKMKFSEDPEAKDQEA